MTTADGSVLGTTQIFGSAPTNRAFNVVLLAEGFTAAEQTAFDTACATFLTAFRATPPYDELAPAINVFRVNVSSTDSGADDPTATGGTGVTPRTYFDATFGGNGIRRLLVCNNTTALTVAAAQVPQFTIVLVVVNSTVYGGSGGSIGTYSLAGGATEIALHEMGHTAYGLADEYPYYAGGAETGHDHHPASPEPTEPNVTTNSVRSTLKWGWAVAAATAIPTMSNPNCSTVDSRPSPVPVDTVGLFEGAHYYHCGAYRPEYDCKMRNLSVPFCRVCRQIIWNRIGPLSTLPARDRTPISVVARYPEHLDVFAVAANGRAMSDWWDQSSGWAGWFQVSGGIASPGGAGSPVTSIARYSGHLDLFTVGTDNRVYSCWWDRSSGWSAWFALGGIVAAAGSTVNVVARYPDHLDLFTTASDGKIVSTWWDARSGWAGWFQVSGGIASPGSPVTAISRYSNHLDLFTVGTDNRIYSTWWHDTTGWAGWFNVSGGIAKPGSQVAAISRITEHIDVFVVGSDSIIYSTWWDGSGGWGGWFQLGIT